MAAFMTSQLKDVKKKQLDVIRICDAFTEISPQGFSWDFALFIPRNQPLPRVYLALASF